MTADRDCDSEDDMNKAIDCIARSIDGKALYLFLQKTLMGVLTGNHPDGALREHEGRRMFAAELMALMAKGIEESSGSDASNHPIVFARRHADAGSKPVSAREFFKRQLAADNAGGSSGS